MKLARLVAPLACAVLLGCASEGGVTGTGVSSSVSGNVSLVSVDATGVPPAPPFPIRVSVDGFPGIESTTNAEGTFEMKGPFSGAVTLQFTNAATSAPIGPLGLEIPSGSATVLENIEIRPDVAVPERIRPNAVRQLDVFGRLDLVDCTDGEGGMLLIADDGRPSRQVMVRLTQDTQIAARDGTPLGCTDLVRGVGLRVDGLLRLADQTIDALSIDVSVSRPPVPDPDPRAERVRGVVSAVDCARALLEVAQRSDPEPVRRIVRLNDATAIECAGDPPQSCGCADIHPGDAITVGGTIAPQRPGLITAEHVIVRASGERATVLAVIAALSCQRGIVDLRQPNETVPDLHAILAVGTEILCGRRACGCANLHLRDRVLLEGTRRVAQPQLIDADRLSVLPPRAI